MNILITGAAGFLGSHLVEHFLKEGHNVVGVDNLSGSTKDNLKDLFKYNFRFVQLDCRDLYNMTQMNLFQGVDVVYHCACLPHEGLSVFSPHLITHSVYSTSVAVFSAAIASGVRRIINMSSMARYGNGFFSESTLNELRALGLKGIPSPFKEIDVPRPVDPYGIAKVAAEETLKCLCETHGVEFVNAVPHNIIGIRQNYTDPHRNVASIMMNRLKQGKDVIIYGDGEQTRCFSPIADVIQCLVRMANLDDKTIVGRTINIGPDKGAITINQLARIIYAIAGKLFNPIYVEDRPREVKHASCSSDLARSLLGYTEQQSLEACLREMWNSIPEGGAPFEYKNKPLEIITERTPKTWTNRLI